MKLEKQLTVFKERNEKLRVAKLDLFLEIHKQVEIIGTLKICRHMGMDRSYLTNTMRRRNSPEVLIKIAEAIIEINGGN